MTIQSSTMGRPPDEGASDTPVEVTKVAPNCQCGPVSVTFGQHHTKHWDEAWWKWALGYIHLIEVTVYCCKYKGYILRNSRQEIWSWMIFHEWGFSSPLSPQGNHALTGSDGIQFFQVRSCADIGSPNWVLPNISYPNSITLKH